MRHRHPKTIASWSIVLLVSANIDTTVRGANTISVEAGAVAAAATPFPHPQGTDSHFAPVLTDQ